MDADRFAALLRTLIARPSRRTALCLLSGLGLAGLIGPTDAKNKHKHKKNKDNDNGKRKGTDRAKGKGKDKHRDQDRTRAQAVRVARIYL